MSNFSIAVVREKEKNSVFVDYEILGFFSIGDKQYVALKNTEIGVAMYPNSSGLPIYVKEIKIAWLESTQVIFVSREDSELSIRLSKNLSNSVGKWLLESFDYLLRTGDYRKKTESHSDGTSTFAKLRLNPIENMAEIDFLGGELPFEKFEQYKPNSLQLPKNSKQNKVRTICGCRGDLKRNLWQSYF